MDNLLLILEITHEIFKFTVVYSTYRLLHTFTHTHTHRERHHRRHRSDPSLPTPHTLTPITVNVSLLVRGVMEGEEQLEASLRREKALSRG